MRALTPCRAPLPPKSPSCGDPRHKGHGQMRSGERPRAEPISPGVKYVFEDETAQASADSMSGLRVRRLPVLNGQKRLVEIVSLGDLALKSNCPAASALEEISKPA